MPLKPYGHTAFGRTTFQIHGRSKAHPNSSSTGCIIFDRPYREKIGKSNDMILKVE